MMRSIRTRTLVWVLSLLGVSLAAISWKSYIDARHEIEELFDAELVQTARMLAGMIDADMPAATREALQKALDQAVGRRGEAVPGHPYESKRAFQVFDGSGARLLQSASAPADLLASLTAGGAEPLRGRALGGYHEVGIGEHRWRLFVLQDAADALWIVVGEREDLRGELVGKITRGSLAPDLVGVPLVGLLVWIAIGWSLRPLRRMAELIKARDPNHLAPLAFGRLPAELEPMAAALSRLLQQINALRERETHFLADAAHELRTPLAVLRIHAQNALDAPDPADRAEALGKLVHGVDRATRLAAQLLTLARLEPNTAAVELRELDLRSFIRNELAELIPLALERDQDLTLIADEAADFHLKADASAIGTLLQNLVANAIQYTPPQGQIQVSLEAAPDHLLLQVQDSGPGVPPAVRTRLFERFFRGDPGAGTGAGLGLAIVQRIAELHHGSVRLHDSPLGGLAVQVMLPRPRAAA